jgi:uncharacterized protein YxjI
MGTSMIFDEESRELLVYAKARFFQWHGFKLFGDKQMTTELSFAKRDFHGQGAKNVLGKIFNFEYVITDTSAGGQEICRFKRKALRSMFRDTWEIMTADGTVAGSITEQGGFRAVMSRILPAFFPQTYTFTYQGKDIAEMKGKFAWFAPKYVLTVLDQSADIRMILNGAALIGGVEGKQGSGS